ncbi:glycosyltransferase family 4 protein [Actinotalea sp. K2]|uniref:glycosyltransferase family 4 protein n=1 Tax=Actinotalea sp. K2 TaxID=2939438 RepID=UPI002016C8DD|nr:glycosyltransferase family 4 protein [Actinotalea sp. K2]MCL3862920.1 glycosyltransferase family 4 protein [Actinotalea sp. K2]
MRIGMLSQWFDPEPGPAAIPGVLARELARTGHTVSVLTGYPNYPLGTVYPGYTQRWREVSRPAPRISVTRVPLHPSHDGSALGRSMNYASFALSASTSGALRGADALWVYNSPVSVSLPLLLHSRYGRVPYFLHVQDVWPDSLLESGMFPGGAAGRVAARVIDGIVRLTERRAAVIGVISPGVRDLILERHPSADPAKIIYVPNPTDESLFRPTNRVGGDGQDDGAGVDVAPDRPFTVMYVGAIGDVQSLETLLDAAEILAGHDHLRFAVVGDGIARDRLETDARRRGLSSVTFHGRVPKESVPALMASADAQLVSLAASPFLRLTTPSKIASLLASEVPVIGHLDGDGARLLRESGAAVTAAAGDASALASAVLAMHDVGPAGRRAMARRGRRYYEQHLTAQVTAARIVESLEAVAR